MAQTEPATNTRLKVSIERMTEHDLLEVVEIEKTCGLSPWGWDSYHRELSSGPHAVMLVARFEDKREFFAERKRIAGFIVSRVIADELHINNIAVKPECQKIGSGSQLLKAALVDGARQRSLMAFLEVRASNRAAQNLYERCGFRVAGRRKGYYRDPPEDALIMSVPLKSKP